MSSSSSEPFHAQPHHRHTHTPAAPPVPVPVPPWTRCPISCSVSQASSSAVYESLLTAPWFVAAHAARSPEPYIVASYANHADLDRDGLVDVLEMSSSSSGRIIKHVSAPKASDMVIVHGSRRIMDLRFLVDPEEAVWGKRYSVQVERSGHLALMHPLLVLEDGKIVTVIRSMNLLQIYDPRTSTFASLMRLRHASRVSVHTGSFLSLRAEN